MSILNTGRNLTVQTSARTSAPIGGSSRHTTEKWWGICACRELTAAAELVAVDLGENNDWRQMVYQTLLQTVHG